MIKAIFQNTTYLLTSEVLVRLISLVQVPILVRYLGKNGYGIWSLAGALPSMLLVITDLGLHSLIVREVSQDKKKLEYSFQYVFSIKIFFSAIFLALVWLIVKLLAYSDDVKFFVYISSLSLICTSLQGLFSAVLRATQKFIYDALLQLANALSLFLGVLIIVLLDYGLTGLMYTQLFGQLILVLICFAFYFRKHSLNYPIVPESEKCLSILRRAIPFALMAIVLPVYYQIDIVMLSKMSGYEATGIYTAAYKIILMFMMISRLLSQVLFPTLSSLHITSGKEFRKTFFFSYRAIALVVFPMAFGLFFIGERVILVLFKREFVEAVFLLRIMSFSLLFSSLHMLLTVALNSSNGEREAAKVIVLVTVFNIVMNFFLIPRFGGVGASISTLLSEIVKYGGSYYYFRKRLFKINFGNAAIKIVVACLGMSIFMIYFNQIILPILIITSGSLYLVLIWLFGVISNEEIKKLINFFTKKTLATQGTK
jgi:O-antigen/teichoic acid export membrane protein